MSSDKVLTLNNQVFQLSVKETGKSTNNQFKKDSFFPSKIISHTEIFRFSAYKLTKRIKSITPEGISKLQDFIERLPLIFEEKIIIDLIYLYHLSEKDILKISSNNIIDCSGKFYLKFLHKYDEILEIEYDQHDIEIDQKWFNELKLLASLKTGLISTHPLFSKQDIEKCSTLLDFFLDNIEFKHHSSFIRSTMPSHHQELYSKLKSFNINNKKQFEPTVRNNRLLKLIRARIAKAIRYNSKRSMEFSIVRLICQEVFVEFGLSPYNISEKHILALGFSLVKVYSCDSCNLVLDNVATMYSSHYDITKSNLDPNLNASFDLKDCNGSFNVRELVWNI